MATTSLALSIRHNTFSPNDPYTLIPTNYTFVNCDANQQAQIKSAIQRANESVNEASAYLNANDKPTSRYTTWFGNPTQRACRPHGSDSAADVIAPRPIVTAILRGIAHPDGFTSRTYECTRGDWTSARAPPTQGYPDAPRTIYLNPGFWDLPPAPLSTGVGDSQPGALVSAATMAQSVGAAGGGTKLYARGRDACERLPRVYPERAPRNSESYMYFVINVPALP
ncbi:hypothetical protein BU17DRAFT_89484 [Hysterangium stoloniferum]|nr:hypothetical protein BU17DRAFT_89484 [Hysterangium stoloniferum]